MGRVWKTWFHSFVRSVKKWITNTLRTIGWDNLSEKARKAFYDATHIATSCGHGQLQPEHLLLALLNESESAAVVIVNSLCNNINDLRDQLQRYVSQIPPARTKREIQLSPAARKVTLKAFHIVREQQGSWVGTHDLLLGILNQPKTFAAQALVNSGITFEKVEQQVKEKQDQEGY